MKLSYREKIVLLVVTLLLILLIFILWPIKSIRANIKTHEATRDKVQITYDENNRLINEIPVIEKNIKKLYTDVKDLNKEFIVHKENFQIDQYIQEIINAPEYIDGDKNKFSVLTEFNQETPEANDLEFYYYSPEIITYPILENADLNGDLIASTDKALYTKVMNAVSMDMLEPQEIEQHKATLKAKFTKEGLFAFLDQLMKNETGIRVTRLKIDDYSFNQNEIVDLASNPDLEDWIGYTSGEIELKFYTMQQIQEPKFD